MTALKNFIARMFTFQYFSVIFCCFKTAKLIHMSTFKCNRNFFKANIIMTI